MARVVMAAILSLIPALPASSSKVSDVMMVESISAKKSFVFFAFAGVNSISILSSCKVAKIFVFHRWHVLYRNTRCHIGSGPRFSILLSIIYFSIRSIWTIDKGILSISVAINVS